MVAPLALIFFHLLKSGIGALNLEFFTHLPKPVGEIGGGMANAIVGSCELLLLAALFRCACWRAWRNFFIGIRRFQTELVDSIRGGHFERRAFDHLGNLRLRPASSFRQKDFRRWRVELCSG